MVNIQDLIDDAKCSETARAMRGPGGVICPHCSSDSVIRNGRDDTPVHRQRYECHACRRRFDDLAGTIFADPHRPLKTWITGLDLRGRNLSGLQIAKELDLNKEAARAMIRQWRQGIVDRRPHPTLSGEVECDGVDVVAGHKGHPEAVRKKAESDDADVWKEIEGGGPWPRRSHRSWGCSSAVARWSSGC